MALFQIYVYIHIYGTGLLPMVLALETGETSEMARLADPQDRRRGLSLQHQSHNKGHRYVPTRMVQIQTPTPPNAGAEPQGRSFGPGGGDAGPPWKAAWQFLAKLNVSRRQTQQSRPLLFSHRRGNCMSTPTPAHRCSRKVYSQSPQLGGDHDKQDHKINCAASRQRDTVQHQK